MTQSCIIVSLFRLASRLDRKGVTSPAYLHVRMTQPGHRQHPVPLESSFKHALPSPLRRVALSSISTTINDRLIQPIEPAPAQSRRQCSCYKVHHPTATAPSLQHRKLPPPPHLSSFVSIHLSTDCTAREMGIRHATLTGHWVAQKCERQLRQAAAGGRLDGYKNSCGSYLSGCPIL
jgi:hypothetical protein